jgi:8-oxo-dGTP pyrophosphatase MutT (NUDIX family)
MQVSQSEQGFLRHIIACNRATPPGGRTPFRIGPDRQLAEQVGWVLPEIVAALAGFPDVETDPGGVTLTRPAALPVVNRELADRGLLRWRGEAFDVRAQPDGPVLAQIDRGALPAFGIAAEGVHVNGLVGDPGHPERLRLWIGRRAADKALDPGKLDHIVAGGVPAGLGPEATLIKEAAEEAAIPAELAAQARKVAMLSYAMDRPEGLRRDRLHCFDLLLPEAFTPRPMDGEVSGFELWPLRTVLNAVRDSDDFKFNVNLVLIDLFLRLGLIAGAEGAELRAALANGPG